MIETILAVVVMIAVACVGLLGFGVLCLNFSLDRDSTVMKIVLTPLIVACIVGVVMLEIELVRIVF